jgi:hypothetical protein
MEKFDFTRACLSRVRVIVEIMCILVVELLCQTAMERALVFKYLLSSVHGCLWLCPVMPDIKYCPFPRT